MIIFFIIYLTFNKMNSLMFLRFASHQIFLFIIIRVFCVGFTVVVQPYGSIYTKNTWIYKKSGTWKQNPLRGFCHRWQHCWRNGKVYYLTQSVHGKKKFRFGFWFFYLTTDILNVNPDVFTLSYSRGKNESMEDGNIGDEARYKMCV